MSIHVVQTPPSPISDADRLTSGRRPTLGGRVSWLDQWRTPLLDADEEVLLATQVEAGLLAAELLDAREASPPGESGDGAAGDAKVGLAELVADTSELEQLVREGWDAWQRFHTSNVGLVLSVVHEVAHTMDDDLVQQGWLALGEAVRRYDMRLGYRFSTFALHWIRNAVVTEYRRRATVLSVSMARLRNLALVGAARAEIVERGGVEDIAHVAARLGRPHEWVQRHWTRAVRTSADITDLDEVVSTRGVDETPPEADLWWLECLPSQERELLELRFGLGGHPPLSCAEVARRWQCPASRVRAMHQRALEHARELALCGEQDGRVAAHGLDGTPTDDPAGPVLTMGWLGLAG